MVRQHGHLLPRAPVSEPTTKGLYLEEVSREIKSDTKHAINRMALSKIPSTCRNAIKNKAITGVAANSALRVAKLMADRSKRERRIF